MKPLWHEKFTTADAIAVCEGRFDSQAIRNHRRRNLLVADRNGEMQGRERVLSLIGVYELAFLAGNFEQGISYPSSARVFRSRLFWRGVNLIAEDRPRRAFRTVQAIERALQPGTLPEFEGADESDPWYWIARADPNLESEVTDPSEAPEMCTEAVRQSSLSQDIPNLAGVAWLFNITALVTHVDEVLTERLQEQKAAE